MAEFPKHIILRKVEETKTEVKYKEFAPKTNADRIRTMSDEELADLLSCSMCSLCVLHYYCKENRNNRNCDDVILEWLKQEAGT